MMLEINGDLASGPPHILFPGKYFHEHGVVLRPRRRRGLPSGYVTPVTRAGYWHLPARFAPHQIKVGFLDQTNGQSENCCGSRCWW